MEIDFSSLSLQYLIQVREIAKKSPELAVAILGLPIELIDVSRMDAKSDNTARKHDP